MTFFRVPFAPVLALAALAGCQAVYPTQFVPFSPLTTEYKNDSYSFKVVDLTPSSAMEANKLWAYTPRTTPAALQSKADSAFETRVIATSLGESGTDEAFLIAQVSQSVDTVSSAADLRNPPPSPSQPYRIGVGDVFTVTIEAVSGVDGSAGRSAYQTETTVDYAGNIYLTDVGEVQVLDKTVAEARQTIANRFRDARLTANGFATVTGFFSQKVLVAMLGKPTSFVPITNTPITLRDAYLTSTSGIDKDARRQMVVMRRDGQNYSTRGLDILRQTYGYEVFLRDGDEIQIFDTLLDDYNTAAVAPEVLALEQAKFERDEAARNQEQFEASERRAEESAGFARENLEIARADAIRAEQQLNIARSVEARAQLEQARQDRDEARRIAAETRADAGEARSARQLSLAELENRRSERQLALSEEASTRSDRSLQQDELNASRELARSRIDLGIEAQDRIFVAGEVGQQQTIPMPFERQFSLAEAIYGGQGIDPVSGDPSRVYVVRVKSTVAGAVESYIFHFDGGNLANTPAMTMFQLRPDDYVLVMPRAVTNWSRFVTQLVPTLNSLVSAAQFGGA